MAQHEATAETDDLFRYLRNKMEEKAKKEEAKKTHWPQSTTMKIISSKVWGVGKDTKRLRAKYDL